jgi:hypothetical protein
VGIENAGHSKQRKCTCNSKIVIDAGCIPNCRMIEFLNPAGSYVYRKIIVPTFDPNGVAR